MQGVKTLPSDQVVYRQLKAAFADEAGKLYLAVKGARELSDDIKGITRSRREELVGLLEALACDAGGEESAIEREELRIRIETTSVFEQWLDIHGSAFDGVIKKMQDGKFHIRLAQLPYDAVQQSPDDAVTGWLRRMQGNN